MSQRSRAPRRSTLAALLREVLRRTASTLYSDRAALYLVQLDDPDGFALALRVHAQIPGPDPVVLRARAHARELRAPFMTGAAPVETLARILETLGTDAESAALRAWAVREAFAGGAIPVVVLRDGGAVVTTLEAFERTDGHSSICPNESGVEDLGGWCRPSRMEA